MVVLTAVLTIALVVTIDKTGKEKPTKTVYALFGVMLFLVLIEVGGIIFCCEKMEKQLVAYIEELNSR